MCYNHFLTHAEMDCVAVCLLTHGRRCVSAMCVSLLQCWEGGFGGITLLRGWEDCGTRNCGQNHKDKGLKQAPETVLVSKAIWSFWNCIQFSQYAKLSSFHRNWLVPSCNPALREVRRKERSHKNIMTCLTDINSGLSCPHTKLCIDVKWPLGSVSCCMQHFGHTEEKMTLGNEKRSYWNSKLLCTLLNII